LNDNKRIEKTANNKNTEHFNFSILLIFNVQLKILYTERTILPRYENLARYRSENNFI